MEIQQTRIVVKARSFDRTSRFYEQVMGFPRLNSWEAEDGRRALFEAGTAVIEVVGRPRGEESTRDEAFDYQGPEHKLRLDLVVPSAEAVYEELLFRDRNIPGGLQRGEGGGLVFGTHDPDGVKIVFREPED